VAAILDLHFRFFWPYDITTILIWYFGPGNICMAVRISLLSCVLVEIYVIRFHAAILNFPFPLSSCLTVEHSIYPYLIVGPRKHRYSCWNFVVNFCTNWDRRNQSLDSAILNFLLSVSSCLTVEHGHYSYVIVWPRTHRYGCWTFVAILSTSWNIRNYSLVATTLNFPLPVSSRLTVQYYHYPHLIVGPRKHRYRGWNCVVLLCRSWDIRNQSLEDAILNFPLPVSSCLTVEHSHYFYMIVGSR